MEHFQTVLEQNLETLEQNTPREQNLRNIWSEFQISKAYFFSIYPDIYIQI